jgi:hypothetical protein
LGILVYVFVWSSLAGGMPLIKLKDVPCRNAIAAARTGANRRVERGITRKNAHVQGENSFSTDTSGMAVG